MDSRRNKKLNIANGIGSFFKGHTPLLILTGIFLTSCGPVRNSSEEAPPPPPLVEEYRVIEANKLIVRGLETPNCGSCTLQHTYSLNADQRLLIRFEGLRAYMDRINYRRGRVFLKIKLTSPDQISSAVKHLKAYPLVTDWMMGATWERAVPFFSSGRWRLPGGDFDTSLEIPVTDLRPTPKPIPKNEPIKPPSSPAPGAPTVTPTPTPTPTPAPVPETDGTLYVDLTKWYLEYPVGRNLNFGLILVTGIPITIFGDGPSSGSFAPRFFWQEVEGSRTSPSEGRSPR